VGQCGRQGRWWHRSQVEEPEEGQVQVGRRTGFVAAAFSMCRACRVSCVVCKSTPLLTLSLSA
jgi:hypothetical protein